MNPSLSSANRFHATFTIPEIMDYRDTRDCLDEGDTLRRLILSADASVVMLFNFRKLPFAVVIGCIMFAERPDLWTITGAAIIFASTYYIARREAKAKAYAERALQPASEH